MSHCDNNSPNRRKRFIESVPDGTTHCAHQRRQRHLKMEEKATALDTTISGITLIAKWGKEKIVLEGLTGETTIGNVKDLIEDRTGVLQKRQKLIGLATNGGAKVTDDLMISDLKIKSGKSQDGYAGVVHSFIMMGSREEHIFVDPSEREDLPDVIDDFDLDFNAGSSEWLQHVANGENLKKFTEHTAVHIMNEPREGKPLLVLDLDHTLLDFSSRRLLEDNSTHAVGQGMAAAMKRPFMDDFLVKTYQHYDLVVWSQTSWRWLETKLTELGMLTHPGYKFCFVLDKMSMFTVKSTKRGGSSVVHHVKPLQIIWSKFPRWGSHNTVHIDDLSRNFALNLTSGLKIKAYYRKKSKAVRDSELLGLSKYLVDLAEAKVSFDDVDFDCWQDVVSGKGTLVKGKP